MIKPLSDLKKKLKSYIVWLDMINRRTLQSQKPITNIKRYIFVKQVCGVLIEPTLHCRDQGCVSGMLILITSLPGQSKYKQSDKSG